MSGSGRQPARCRPSTRVAERSGARGLQSGVPANRQSSWGPRSARVQAWGAVSIEQGQVFRRHRFEGVTWRYAPQLGSDLRAERLIAQDGVNAFEPSAAIVERDDEVAG